MRCTAYSLLACLLLSAVVAAQPAPSALPPGPPPAIKVGDQAPAFSLNWFAPKAVPNAAIGACERVSTR